jgi:hypothetical protein
MTFDYNKVNEPIDDKVFTIAGFDLPLGTKINDLVHGIDYRYGGVQYAEELLENKYSAFQESTPNDIGELVNNNAKRSDQETVVPVDNSEAVDDSEEQSTIIASRIKLKPYAIIVVAFVCLCFLFIVRHKMKRRQNNA